MGRVLVVYIDEAGDEGFGKLAGERGSGQSHWLVLGAMIVDAEKDREVPTWRDEILTRFPNRRARTLHFRDLNHDQRVVVCQEIARRPIRTCLAFCHKPSLLAAWDQEDLKAKGAIYRHLTFRLVERLTWHCRVQGPEMRLRLVFSRRGGTDYAQFVRDLKILRDTPDTPGWSIDWSSFDPDSIEVMDHPARAGLQLADCITSAYFKALERNAYGNLEPSYRTVLDRCLLTQDGVKLGHGLYLSPTEALDSIDLSCSALFIS